MLKIIDDAVRESWISEIQPMKSCIIRTVFEREEHGDNCMKRNTAQAACFVSLNKLEEGFRV